MEDKGRPTGPELGTLLSLGLQLAISVIAFVFLGVWLDGVFSTKPILTIVGACIGVTGSMIRFFKTATDLGRQADKEMAEHRKKNNV